MREEISELLKYRRSIRDKYNWPPNSKMGSMVSFIWLWHNYPLELQRYAKKYTTTWELCPKCGAHKANYQEMMGEECCK